MHLIQERIMNLFKNHKRIPLNYRQIGKIVGAEHPQKIKHHLEQLEKRGFIKIDQDNETISNIKLGSIKDTDLVAIPIVGSANCGQALTYANQEIEGYLKVSNSLLKKKKGIIAIKANGNSMNRANIEGNSIENGDYVLVDCGDKIPQNGDYVLSIIDGLANIKKFIEDTQNQQIILLSESTMDYPPIYIDPSHYDYIIDGKVIRVLKKPSQDLTANKDK